ncbi:methyl-accepting chemotaxis protein [Stutzerimonas nitrititolerans]|uniref:methyl-accepting chemotaxis protein n=1 Tax=Stutzerimonas nitrititolerans TaxID=2482751 RepID=UPI0028A8221A|nr:methyl-accepting chemotaxis protein [Stutzerimonas nitrititolerans]
MSTNNSLISAVGFLILATGSGAAYTGYNYLQGVAQDTFMLKHAYSLQNSIAQAVYLTERAASDSTYVPELEALEAAAEKAISDLRAGDPVRGIPPAPPAVQANVSALQSVWSEVVQSLAQIISRRGVTDQYSRNLADAGRAAEEALRAAQNGTSRLDSKAVNPEVLKRLNGAVAMLQDGTNTITAGTSTPVDTIRAASALFAQYVSELASLGTQLPKTDAALPLLVKSYRDASSAQVLIQRAIDNSSGATENIPHAKSVWAARDRISAATIGLLASVEASPDARPYGARLVSGLTGLTLFLAITGMFLMRSITTSRTAQVEHKGYALESSTRNKSKEMKTLLGEIGQIADGDLKTTLTESNESTSDIAKELNRLVQSFGKILDDVSQTIAGLAAATEQAVVTDRNVTQNRTEQEEAIAHINQLFKTLLQFINQIEEMTASTETTSGKMLTEVDRGEQAVTLVHENIITLQQHIQAIHHRSKHLIESFQTLENISSVVRDVAAKTSMVSYQADLIAQQVDDKAVAKSITTSASSMQRLSQETREAVIQIQVVLKEMNDAALETQRAVLNAQHETDQLRDRSTSAQLALSGISAMTNELSTSVEKVIEGTRSMKENSSEVDHTMSAIVQYTVANSASSEQTAGAIKAVNAQAQGVQKLIAEFRREPS